MTNREKLNNMALIDVLMYLDVCNSNLGFTNKNCLKEKGDCYKCRMHWLNEQCRET